MRLFTIIMSQREITQWLKYKTGISVSEFDDFDERKQFYIKHARMSVHNAIYEMMRDFGIPRDLINIDKHSLFNQEQEDCIVQGAFKDECPSCNFSYKETLKFRQDMREEKGAKRVKFDLEEEEEEIFK